MKSILISLFVAILTSCEPKDSENCHYKIVFDNHTDTVLYTLLNDGPIMYRPDPRNNEYLNRVEALERSESVLRGGLSRPECIENNFNSDGLLYVFVYEESLFDEYTWEELKSLNLYSERYEFNFNDLQFIDFEIEYEN